MEIKLQESPSKGMFYIEQEGRRLGEMTFSKSEGLIIIDHTGVSDELRGKGAGRQLVAAGVEYARKNNVKIIPLCPFAKGVFDRVEEYRDVLKD